MVSQCRHSLTLGSTCLGLPWAPPIFAAGSNSIEQISASNVVV